MTYRGQVRNGVVVLDRPGGLPEGAEVEVSALEGADATPTLFDRLKDVVGIVDELPPDMAEKHDQYIHGAVPSSP